MSFIGSAAIRLVKLYIAEPALWDRNYEVDNPEKRRRDRACAFRRIAGIMAANRASIKDVTLKIKTMRKLYKQEKMRRLRQQRRFRAAKGNAATPPPPPFVSKYSWFTMCDNVLSAGCNAQRRRTQSSASADVPLSIPTTTGTSSGAGNAELRRTQSSTPEDMPSSTEDFTREEKVPSSNAHNNGNMSTEPRLSSTASISSFELYLNHRPVQSVVDQFVSHIEGCLEKMTPNVAVMALKEINDEVIKQKLMEFN